MMGIQLSQVPLLTYKDTGPTFVSFTLQSRTPGTCAHLSLLLPCTMLLTRKAKSEAWGL